MPDLASYALLRVILSIIYQTLVSNRPRVAVNQDANDMHRGPHRLGRRPLFPPRYLQQPQNQPDLHLEEPENTDYEPTVTEVLVLKEQLQSKSRLPIELIETIIDLAEYWPHSSSTFNGHRRVVSGDPAKESAFIMRSQPLGYIPEFPYQPTQKTPYSKMVPWKLNAPIQDDYTQKVVDQWKIHSCARGERPCRKIVFTFLSHDQGHSGNLSMRGSYKESWTWFAVGKEELLALKDPSPLPENEKSEPKEDRRDLVSTIKEKELAYIESKIRSGAKEETAFCVPQTVIPLLNNALDQPVYGTKFTHPLLPVQDTCIQKNKMAIGGTQRHVVTWRYDDDTFDPDSVEANELEVRGRGRRTGDGKFVREMKVGDAVTVWAMARFPGWYNQVEGVAVKVYWAV